MGKNNLERACTGRPGKPDSAMTGGGGEGREGEKRKSERKEKVREKTKMNNVRLIATYQYIQWEFFLEHKHRSSSQKVETFHLKAFICPYTEPKRLDLL